MVYFRYMFSKVLKIYKHNKLIISVFQKKFTNSNALILRKVFFLKNFLA